MPRPKAGERIRGPYEDKSRGRWRIDEIAADGSITRSFHRSEAIAAKYRELLEASISAVERDTATAIEAYRRFLKQKGNKPGSIDRTLWSLRQFFPKPLPLASLKPARCKGLY